ncbi:MAG: hypothetical protein ABIM30_01330 [candidate division WOR-3 bacterium]
MREKILNQIKSFPLAPIKTKSQYQKAIEILWKILFDEDLKEYRYLLVLLVKEYEHKLYEKKFQKLENDVLFDGAIKGQKSGYLTKKQSSELMQKWLKDLDIKVKWSEKDQVFIAKSKKFPGLAAHGKTKKEAKKELLACIKGVEQWSRKK